MLERLPQLRRVNRLHLNAVRVTEAERHSSNNAVLSLADGFQRSTPAAALAAASARATVRGCSVRQGVRLYRRGVQAGVQKQGERAGEAGVQGDLQDGP